MNDGLSTGARRVQNVIKKLGFDYIVIELAESTRSVKEAAQAVGCLQGQIIKSLIFKTRQTHRAVLVIASGSNRVNEKLIGQLLSEEIEKADADFARSSTGFSIGGIPPVGHSRTMITFLDEDLLQYKEVWAAAGTPNAVFKMDPADLRSMTQGTIVRIN